MNAKKVQGGWQRCSNMSISKKLKCITKNIFIFFYSWFLAVKLVKMLLKVRLNIAAPYYELSLVKGCNNNSLYLSSICLVKCGLTINKLLKLKLKIQTVNCEICDRKCSCRGGGGRVRSRSLLCSRKRLLLLYCEKGIIDFSEPDYANIHKLMLNFG